MKIKHILIKLTFYLMLLMFIKCEYDVTQPLWYKDYPELPIPSIVKIYPPEEATPGCNYIKIFGSNFVGKVSVYFDNVKANVVSASNDSIVVRRPAISKDSCVVKVVCDSAMVVAKYSPYKIHKVIEPYGNFLENKQLNAVTVDDDENIYVVEKKINIYKITSSGDKTIIGTANRIIYDITIGFDNNLYLFENNRAIDVLNLQTKEMTQWIKLKSGKVVKYGDFTSHGYLVTGGRRSGLVVVTPDKNPIYTDYYIKDEIIGIRVYNGYVYVNVICNEPDENNPEFAIWRHSIDSKGNVADKELVLNLTNFTDQYFTDIDQINSFYFSEDGRLFIGVSAENPLLVYDFNTQTMDFFYLGIVPSYCKYFAWGTQSYIYLIRGDNDLEEEWTMYRIDIGMNKGSK